MRNTDLTIPADALSGCVSRLSSVRVLVNHRDPLLAAGMETTLLRAGVGFEVVRHDRESFPAQSTRIFYPSTVVVADYDAGMRRANDTSRRGGILIVTQFDDEARIRRAIQHGIRGYLLQGSSSDDLIQGVLALHRGATAFAPVVEARIAESLTCESLTARQLTVLRYLMPGCSNKEISHRMRIADGTVKAHVRAIFAKLGANNRTEAVAIARRRGLLLESLMPDLKRESPVGCGVPNFATRMTGTGY